MVVGVENRSRMSDNKGENVAIRAITRGKNTTYLQNLLLQDLDPADCTQVFTKAEELISQLPDPQTGTDNKQGLLLGLVQSGKTGALTAAIAMAADSGFRCFIVLTTDNLWLYGQTIDRLKAALPGLQVVGKDEWPREIVAMRTSLLLPGSGIVLVATKNATVLDRLNSTIDALDGNVGRLPAAIVIDDEADQASLDTMASKRARRPAVDPGRINDAITRMRNRFPRNVFLQVTATPQALFLQDRTNLFRPEFTVLVEPGQGYIGGKSFFSLIDGRSRDLIRQIDQEDLDTMLVTEGEYIPDSLRRALCTFFIGATVKYLQGAQDGKRLSDLTYSFLCHISIRKGDHEIAYAAISSVYEEIRAWIGDQYRQARGDDDRSWVLREVEAAYSDLAGTAVASRPFPSLGEVLAQLRDFVVGTDIQIVNSDKEQDQPKYNRRYNIIIGGTKLARGVTIKGLLVTYYGRQPQNTNMDTMLQHARMYGYREKDLDAIRLFISSDVEDRFRIIHESEEALWEVIRQYPNEDYRGIVIGGALRATRTNVLNPNNIGAYAAGSAYFPRRPTTSPEELGSTTNELDAAVEEVYPPDTREAIQVSLDDLIRLIGMTKSNDTGGGLWNKTRIIAALEMLKSDPRYQGRGYLIVRRGRDLGPRQGTKELGTFFGGGSNDASLARKEYPSLFLYKLTGQKWDGVPFWVPNLRFPDGQYAMIFNFD